jgi:lipopolysaccharide export LptBFGC system permease protein LptF
MGALLKLLFAVLLVGLFISGFFYFIASILGSIAFNPDTKAWKELIAKLRAKVNQRNDQPLMQLDSEHLALLSLKPMVLKKASWGEPVFEGTFNTIYKDRVMVFAGQKSGKTAVFVAKTSDKEFIFRQKARETEVWMDGQPFAVFVEGALLSAGKQPRMLAKLETDGDLRQWPVLLGQGEAATITNGERAVSPIPRAVTLLRNLSPEEEQTLLVLAVMQGLKA